MDLSDAFGEPDFVRPIHSGSGPGVSVSRPWGHIYIAVALLIAAIVAILMNSIFCFPFALAIGLVISLPITASLWLAALIIGHLNPLAPKGLSIGEELGKFTYNTEEGCWAFCRTLLGGKASLDLTSSSPHILIAGGSQTGKSSAIKTILSKLMGADAERAEGERRLFAIIVVAGLVLAAIPILVPAVLTPIMLAIYVLGSNRLDMVGVYEGYLAYFTVIASLCGLAAAAVRIYSRLGQGPSEKGRRTVVFDYHGEYGFLKDAGFAVADARDFDPLAPNHPGEPFEQIATDFIESFLVAFETTGDVQLAILKKKLEECKGIEATLASIRGDNKSARSFTDKDRLSGLTLRLEKIAAYAKGRSDIAKLGDGNIVFDFSGIHDRDAADFYAESILRRLAGGLASQMGRSPQDTWTRGVDIIIDEAHRLNTKPLHDKGVETSTMRIARECGKFGGRLIISSQNLTDFPQGFSSNFGNIICFRTPSGAEMHALEKTTGISYGLLQSVMNGLKKGEALLIGPRNHYSIIRVSLPKTLPSSKTLPSQIEKAQGPATALRNTNTNANADANTKTECEGGGTSGRSPAPPHHE